MKLIRQFIVTLILSNLLSVHLLNAQSDRPPQFVVFAFDGSKTINFWQDTRDFTLAMRNENVEVPFTYFLSGVVFLKDSQKRLYVGPKHTAGQSDISFGGPQAELISRIDQINAAIKEGHEMGSHANGHFDGQVGRWTESDWMLEFKLFNWLIADVIKNNALPNTVPPLNLNPEKDVVGFRAPYLGVNTGLWATLKNYKYSYDTSRVAEANYWPKKLNNVWNFPLAMLKIVDTNKKTLSMDYNFYVADSGAKPDAANSEVYRSRMKRTYLNYFNSNYRGNRAPLHIGHHFSRWNGGAYHNALKDFAKEVCGKPEVRCVTYKELTKYMESLDAQTIEDFQLGKFERQNSPVLMKDFKDLSTKTKVYSSLELQKLGLQVDPPEAHAEEY